MGINQGMYLGMGCLDGWGFVTQKQIPYTFTGVVARGRRKFDSVVHRRLRQSVVGNGSWKKFLDSKPEDYDDL